MKHHLILTLAAMAGISALHGQNQTVGTFLNTDESYDGYTLLDPMGSGATHLINNCGEVINTWSSEYNTGGACYLLEDGSLVRGCRMSGAFAGGGIGGRLERKSWDDELLWVLDWADDQKHHHHDFAWMPNGHVLVLAWELKTTDEAAQVGRANPQVMWPEFITEISPEGAEGGTIIWEWHAWDHLIQDVDESLPNFGEASDYPNRLDVNFANVGGGGGPGGANSGDWMHANAVNYNPTLDQIAISARRFNEIWIIDHATTTEEAAGPAGDILYRYGNPEAYGRGTSEDRVFWGQHDVQWIPEGHPQEGALVIYNNGAGRPGCECSTIDVWNPPLLEDGSYLLNSSSPFGPESWTWTYPTIPSSQFFSSNISGVQPQPNGNFFICQGADGRLFEVTQEGNVVWEYINPEGNLGIFPQGATPQQNNVFRSYRYGPNYEAFEGRDLTPSAPLEGLSSFECDLYPEQGGTSTLENFPSDLSIQAYPNPASTNVHLIHNEPGIWKVFNGRGSLVLTIEVQEASSTLVDCTEWPTGVYVASFQPFLLGSKPSTLTVSITH